MSEERAWDIIVIGGGLAGLTSCLPCDGREISPPAGAAGTCPVDAAGLHHPVDVRSRRRPTW